MPATNQQNIDVVAPTLTGPEQARQWTVFAYQSFARIIARKHNVVVPQTDLDNLSNEELDSRLRLLQDLAHLPPA